MHPQHGVRSLLVCAFGFALISAAARGGGEEALTVIAIGGCADNNGVLRGCGTYITNMHTGQHDAGRFQALFFLGNNFSPTGLNIPVDDIQGRVRDIFEPFRLPLDELGRANVHALAGSHDYYARYAIETSVLFGLVKIAEAPMGLTNKGNRREAAIESWTYHYGMPGQAVYPVASGAGDSVQFIFFDSAILLRTPPASWSPALDSLRRMLLADRKRPGILWRIFCAHHPFMSVGEHAGYSIWNDEEDTVEYVTPCDRDSNALSWLRNSFDPEDLCTERYRAYCDSVSSAIRACGITVQAALAGHEQSLQFIVSSAAGWSFPTIQIISGAGSIPARVKFPSPPLVYTSARLNPSDEGESSPGFVQLRFTADRLRVVFYSGSNGDPVDMGNGVSEFWIGRDGRRTEKN